MLLILALYTLFFPFIPNQVEVAIDVPVSEYNCEVLDRIIVCPMPDPSFYTAQTVHVSGIPTAAEYFQIQRGTADDLVSISYKFGIYEPGCLFLYYQDQYAVYVEEPVMLFTAED